MPSSLRHLVLLPPVPGMHLRAALPFQAHHKKTPRGSPPWQAPLNIHTKSRASALQQRQRHTKDSRTPYITKQNTVRSCAHTAPILLEHSCVCACTPCQHLPQALESSHPRAPTAWSRPPPPTPKPLPDSLLPSQLHALRERQCPSKQGPQHHPLMQARTTRTQCPRAPAA